MQDQYNRISILVVEADGLLRDMLRTVLAAESRLQIVGVTGDAAEAIRLATNEKPDVALVGLDNDSEHDALAVAQAISGSRSSARIVFLGEHPDRRTLAALPAFRAGAGPTCSASR
jgi:DNA-binding NarL/FixJ family response regulator